jgi:rhamnosyl/mannosyltransferase
MNVLHLCKFYHPVPGGIETVVRDIAQGLTRRRWSVDVLCANTVRETAVDRDGAVSVVRAGSLGLVASTSMAPALVTQLLRQPAHDVVHAHLPDPMTNLALLIARPRAKLVLHWHSDIVKQKLLLKLYAPLQNWLMRRADAIIATSPPYAESSPWLRRFADRIHFVPCGIVDPLAGVDEAVLQRQVAAIKAQHAGKRIVFALGRMTYYKGFEVLVEAASRLPEDVVVLIGGHGELLEPLRAKARAHGVADKVLFIGKVPDETLAAHYQAASAFCLPSLLRSEAFGVVLVEAMSHALPIVATEIPGSGVPWVNQHGVTGFNAQPGDPVSLAAALCRLLDDPAGAARMGRNGRRRFEEHFTIDRMIDAVETVYTRIGVGAPGAR